MGARLGRKYNKGTRGWHTTLIVIQRMAQVPQWGVWPGVILPTAPHEPENSVFFPAAWFYMLRQGGFTVNWEGTSLTLTAESKCSLSPSCLFGGSQRKGKRKNISMLCNQSPAVSKLHLLTVHKSPHIKSLAADAISFSKLNCSLQRQAETQEHDDVCNSVSA